MHRRICVRFSATLILWVSTLGCSGVVVSQQTSDAGLDGTVLDGTVDPQYEHDATPDADLVGPDDPARARRLSWASLFRRVWREDVLVCSRCGGELRLVAVIEDPAVIERILKHVGLWKRGPPRERRVVLDPADRAPIHYAD
jgi:hypothetical protein